MSRTILAGGFLAALAIGCNHAPAPGDAGSLLAAATDTGFHYVKPLAAPRGLHLSGFNGSIDVGPSDDGNVDVRAVIRAPDPGSVKVIAKEEPRGVVVCVLVRGESPDDCAFGETERRSGGHDGEGDLRVDLVARVPRGVPLIASTMNGAITARDLSGDARATTMNGNIELSTSAVAEARTLNGSIDVTMKARPSRPLTFETQNGDVKVKLPAASDADVESSTSLGSLSANFPMDVASTPMGFGPKSGRGRIGRGGVLVRGETQRGDVSFKVE
jgi:hypothetical protein